MRGIIWVSLLLSAGVFSPLAATLSPAQREFFETRIRPVLVHDCYECHNSQDKAKGGLALDHRAALLKGGVSGPAIVPGDAEASRLIGAIRHTAADLKMPKSRAKLDDAVIGDFVKWVNDGAPDPRDNPPTQAELASANDWETVFERRKDWWSFRPIRDVKPPQIAGAAHPVDRFIRAKLMDAGLQPSPAADAPTFIRRLNFALIGLPPTRDEILEFEKAHAADPQRATEALIDRLLASPHFGERWARHWMDWTRYAESHGSEGDPIIGNAHLYRDYLIRALNADIPYNQLVREHVAGDLLEHPRFNRELGINESLIGTAHWRMVFHGFAPTDALDEKVRFTDDQIDAFTKAFLGMTVSCSRCHDHKFDAISQADYYALFGILGSTRPGRAAIDLPENLNKNRDQLRSQKDEVRMALANEWRKSLPRLEREVLAPAKPDKQTKARSSVLRPIALTPAAGASPDAFATAWKQRVDEWQADRERRRLEDAGRGSRPEKAHSKSDAENQSLLTSAATVHQWPLGQDEAYQDWFRYGSGLPRKAARAGAFAIAPSGDKALAGIYPAGAYSHLISSKDAARLTSPDIHLDGEYELWLRITGGGNATARYVVQNYPRRGTVYPITELKDNQAGRWRWQKYNLAYWNGDDIHVELSAANDAPLEMRNSDRSWFGIREAVVVKKGAEPPADESFEFLDPLFEAAATNPPTSRADLVRLYSDVLDSAIQAWASNTATDAQAVLLDACLREDVLANDLKRLGRAKTAIAEYRKLESEVPVPTRIPTLAEWRGHDQPLFVRGNHKQPGERVPRRFLSAIDDSPYDTHLSGRRQLAEDLLRNDNPLTRRVIVNRVWHHLFGRGIVDTPDNLGALGSKPSHPELLDHLATRFVSKDRWSLKSLIRFLVTSETWRQSSVPSEMALAMDPDNRLLSHFTARRLEAEAIRDALLQVSGRLDDSLYGAPVDGNAPRRSVYVRVIRNRLDPFLNAFDAPVPFSAKGRRDVTTVPAQSLALLNGDFAKTAAQTMGRRYANKFGEIDESAINALWFEAFGRRATADEVRAAKEFISVDARMRGELEDRIAKLDAETREAEKSRDRLERIAWNVLSEKRGEPKPAASLAETLKPVAEWKFDENGRDGIGGLDCEMIGSARVENGALILDGNGFARSKPLKQSLNAKTLEAWVQLNDLNQRGGGVFTVQTRNGVTFDSIVIGEKDAKQWLAGSNNFRRTESFNAPPETEAIEKPVHVVIVYQTDGTILGYRNGRPYGRSFKKDELQPYAGDDIEILFGLRHGRGVGGNRMLKGRIHEARLYERALKPAEVEAASRNDANYISDAELLATLKSDDRVRLVAQRARIERLQTELNQLRSQLPAEKGAAAAAIKLAHAIFNMKEFIYVR